MTAPDGKWIDFVTNSDIQFCVAVGFPLFLLIQYFGLAPPLEAWLMALLWLAFLFSLCHLALKFCGVWVAARLEQRGSKTRQKSTRSART
jgi:hypothetical protein